MAIIPGFNTKLSGSRFIAALRHSRFAHAEPTKTFCPADNNLIERRRAKNMMANRQLATASLLAKKLATPNTSAVFDFRLGPAGNIGSTITAARTAKRLFLRIAGKLQLRVKVAITEDRVFPCSALGRLESLFLLWRVLENRELLPIDREHLDLCISLSAKASNLVHPERLGVGEIKNRLNCFLQNGEVKRRFAMHLAAQGASWEGFEALFQARDRQRSIPILAQANGFWIPPDLNRAKQWIKSAQQQADRVLSHLPAKERQVGLQLHRTPGATVKRGDLVIEVRYPEDLTSGESPHSLEGAVKQSAIQGTPQMLD